MLGPVYAEQKRVHVSELVYLKAMFGMEITKLKFELAAELRSTNVMYAMPLPASEGSAIASKFNSERVMDGIQATVEAVAKEIQQMRLNILQER